VDPVLAPGRERLALSCRYRGSRVRICALPDCVQASADRPLDLVLGGRESVRLEPRTQTFELSEAAE
jgi:hypothetical protein